jgi:hypothetical protein
MEIWLAIGDANIIYLNVMHFGYTQSFIEKCLLDKITYSTSAVTIGP